MLRNLFWFITERTLFPTVQYQQQKSKALSLGLPSASNFSACRKAKKKRKSTPPQKAQRIKRAVVFLHVASLFQGSIRNHITINIAELSRRPVPGKVHKNMIELKLRRSERFRKLPPNRTLHSTRISRGLGIYIMFKFGHDPLHQSKAIPATTNHCCEPPVCERFAQAKQTGFVRVHRRQ